MMYLQIIAFWIIIGYIVSIIIGRILTYSAAILHNWCMMVIDNHQFWYNKGTTIKDIYNDISTGDNFQTCNDTKYVPFINVLIPIMWLTFGELLFFIFIVLILMIGFLFQLIWVKCLSKLLSPIFKYLKNINWSNTWIVKLIRSIIKVYHNIKNFILNIKVS